MDEFYGLNMCLCENKEGDIPGLQMRRWDKSQIDNKDWIFRYHMISKLRKTLQMFEYEGLPDEIPKRILELFTQWRGFTVLHPFKDKFYVSRGTLGGKPNFNYMPSKAIVANPYLGCYKEFEIDKECVVIPNDSMYVGMLPLNNYFSSQETETDISMNILKINTRIMAILSAQDQDTADSLVDVMDALKEGKSAAAVDNDIMSGKGIQSNPMSVGNSSQTIIQLLEEKQYTRGGWWNEVGVQANYNMKRETITSSENILNVDSILPLADDMKEQREIAFEKAKKLFGLNIKVDFSSSWKKLRTEIRLKEEINEKEAKSAGKEVQSIEPQKNKEEEKPNEDTGK